MIVIGVTGNIASGKSTVDRMLLDLGATRVIDADRTVHDLQRDDPDVRAAIRERFGAALFDAEGRLDRRALGTLVFSDPGALSDLEAILHPAVRRRVRGQLAALPDDALVVVDAVKLLQGELRDLCQSVWWVTARPDQQVQRLMSTRGLDEAAARARMAAQPAQAAWRQWIDVIIDNSGAVEDTRRQVATALARVLAVHRHPGDGAAEKKQGNVDE